MTYALLVTLALLSCAKPEAAILPAEPAIADEGTEFSSQMLAEVNALRQSGCRCGGNWMPPAPALSWNGQLAQAAQRHAYDMYSHGFFSHRGSDGSDMARRVNEAGYAWRSVAENIAWGHPNVSAVVQGWKNSAGHCENMMSQDYTEMGAARAGEYWVQDLGRR